MTPEAVAAVTNPAMAPLIPNDRAWRAAEVPAGNGQASARGLARIFGAVANGGALGGMRLMSPQTIAALATVQTERVDLLLGVAPRWAHGVTLNGIGIYGPNPSVFGHSGWGGSFVCADTEAKVAIGYVLNQMGDSIVGDPRATFLANAIYACL